MSTDPHLGFAKYEYLAIRDRILAGNPDLDDQTLADTVEGLSDLPDKLATILRDGLEAETMAMALEIRIKQMRARAARFSRRAEHLRAVVCDIMIEVDIKKLMMPDFTASVRKNPPGVVVFDEALIPADYVELRRHILRREIGEALKNGTPVEGAVLTNSSMTLTVRTR